MRFPMHKVHQKEYTEDASIIPEGYGTEVLVIKDGKIFEVYQPGKPLKNLKLESKEEQATKDKKGK